MRRLRSHMAMSPGSGMGTNGVVVVVCCDADVIVVDVVGAVQ